MLICEVEAILLYQKGLQPACVIPSGQEFQKAVLHGAFGSVSAAAHCAHATP